MVKILTVLVSTISNSQVFLQMQKLLTLFFSNNISVYAIFNDQSFNDTLTNDIVRGLLLGSAAGGVASVFPLLAFHSWAVVSLLRRRAAFAFRGWSVVPEPVQVIGTSWGRGEGCSLQGCWARGVEEPGWWRHLGDSVGDVVIWSVPAVCRFPVLFLVFLPVRRRGWTSRVPDVRFCRYFLRSGMVGEVCLPSDAYYPRTPDYTLYSGVHVCWSEHSDSSFVYGFMSLDYGLGTMTETTFKQLGPSLLSIVLTSLGYYTNAPQGLTCC